MLYEIAPIMALIMSSFSAGFILPAYLELRRVRKELEEKVSSFDSITKKASEANLSVADKVLQLEEKISNLEFWRSNTALKR